MSSEDPGSFQPRLIAQSGPLRGQTFNLEDETSIGRQGTTLVLDGPFVSRRHCSIKKVGVRYILTDSGSHNGTIVNGERITERMLDHADQIQVGNSRFVVALTDEELPGISADVEFTDEEISSTRTFTHNPAEVDRLQAEKNSESDRSGQDLGILLQIAKTVNDSSGLGSLQSRLIHWILNVIPADGAAILLAPADGAGASPFAESARDSRPVIVSRSVVDRVLRERMAISINGIQDAPDTGSSLALSLARAVACVPLLVRGYAIGALYLVKTEDDSGFDEYHLQLLTAIASMTALPLDTARQVERLQSENRRLRRDIDSEYEMIGNSDEMMRVYQFISRVAATDSTVLICGETGPGKELVARAIHRLSARARMPFIAMNCGAIAETLVESELFGHEKGAFTGAVASAKGKFEVADGGTIFLDEVAELPLPAQAKLLRVLQERELNRIGNPRPIKINVRVVAATNLDLEEEIRNGRFRKDLFYRLNVVAVTLPPLRDRRRDIMVLADHFLAKLSASCNRRMTGISREAESCLTKHDWPGNVRELENTIERAINLGVSDIIQLEDLPEELTESTPSDPEKADFHGNVREHKRRLITQALADSAGNHLEAAKVLGLNRTYLHRLIKTLKIPQ